MINDPAMTMMLMEKLSYGWGTVTIQIEKRRVKDQHYFVIVTKDYKNGPSSFASSIGRAVAEVFFLANK
jgi:hypothetical protein